ncbi:hypothetical protein [Nonomuraea guangzhouensis]|uniref:Uncharacterized protein n=2 Tax=Nonomuraea guangzhouensis TaxID=1291555 RepID=A0ABW4GTC6_9ACTN
MVGVIQEGGRRRGIGETTIPCGLKNFSWSVTTATVTIAPPRRWDVLTKVSVRVRQSGELGGVFTVARTGANLTAACGR